MFNPWNATFMGMPNNSMSSNGISKCNEFLTNFYNNIIAFGSNQGLSKTDITVLNTKGITAFEDNDCYVLVFYYRNTDIPLVEYKDLIGKVPQERDLKSDITNYFNANFGKIAWCVYVDKSQIDNYELFMSEYISYLKNEIAEQEAMKRNDITINNPGVVNMGSGTVNIKDSYIIGGKNNKITINKVDKEVFNDIRTSISAQINSNEAMLTALSEMEDNYGQETFKDKYKLFIQSAANHIAIIAPFIPALTNMIPK